MIMIMVSYIIMLIFLLGSPRPSPLTPQASGLSPQPSPLTPHPSPLTPHPPLLTLMIMILIMTRTMVSDDHHEAPRAVKGSVIGSSMDMWSPHGIGRESWDREVRRREGVLSSPP